MKENSHKQLPVTRVSAYEISDIGKIHGDRNQDLSKGFRVRTHSLMNMDSSFEVINQWFSTFLMLHLFNTVPHVVVTIKLFLLLTITVILLLL